MKYITSGTDGKTARQSQWNDITK